MKISHPVISVSIPPAALRIISGGNLRNLSEELAESILSGKFVHRPPSPFQTMNLKELQMFLQKLEFYANPTIASIGVFDRSDGLLYIYPGENGDDGAPILFSAGNNVTRPNGDPYVVGSNGPAPNGTFPVQRPLDTGESQSYGPYYFPVGNCGTSPTCSGPLGGDIARKRGIGIHGGRSGPQSETWGCIRLNDDDVKELQEMNQIDPLTQLTIRD